MPPVVFQLILLRRMHMEMRDVGGEQNVLFKSVYRITCEVVTSDVNTLSSSIVHLTITPKHTLFLLFVICIEPKLRLTYPYQTLDSIENTAFDWPLELNQPTFSV